VSTLDLVSIDRAQGWAYVRNGDEILLVLPPYLEANVTLASEIAAHRSIDVGGYEDGENRAFQSWRALFEWLDGEFVEERRRRGMQLPSRHDTELYIRECSADDIRQFILIIRHELLPHFRDETAHRLLQSLLSATAVESDPNLKNEVRTLDRVARSRIDAARLYRFLGAGTEANDESARASREVRRMIVGVPVPSAPIISAPRAVAR
jgi:hypothetical protein